MYSNDPLKRIQVITVKADIRVPVYVSTPYIYLAGLSDSPITKTVRIEAREEGPIHLEPLSFDLKGKVIYRIEEVEPGRKFRIEVSTIPGQSGTFLGALELKTNHPKKPTLTIRIRGRIKRVPDGTREKPAAGKSGS